MSEQPKWMPSDEAMDRARVEAALLRETFGPGSDDNEPIRALIRTAVEKALAEVKAAECRNGHWPVYHHADIPCPACVERERGEKALAEVRQEWADQIAAERRMVAARPEYAEKAAIFELQRQLSEQEARHRREVIEAKISALMDFRVEIGNETGLDDALALYLTYLRAELAALDKEAKGE